MVWVSSEPLSAKKTDMKLIISLLVSSLFNYHLCVTGCVQIKQRHRQRSGSGRPSSSAPGQQRRRYQRVVRNENAPPPDQPDDNPYVVRKFTQVSISTYIFRLCSVAVRCFTFQLRDRRSSLLHNCICSDNKEF